MTNPVSCLVIDPRSGFCKSNSTFYSKRKPLDLPANPWLDVTTFISSQSHRGTTAYIDATTGQSISFSDLWRAVHSVADYLHNDVGLKKGDVVLILSPNSIYIPVVCLAIVSLGAILTTSNPLNTAREIATQMADSNPTLVFTTDQLVPKLAIASPAISVVLVDEEKRGENTRGVRVVGVLSEMMRKEQSCEQRVRDVVNQDDTAMMLYSSGTTGPSKGVISTHGNLIANTARLVSEKPVEDEIFICTVPMFHIFGLLGFAMATVAMGRTVVILRRFGLDDMLAAVEKYRANVLGLAPPVVVAMINGADQIKAKYDLSSLRKIRVGGAPLSKEATESFMEKYPTVSIFQGYALTESNGAGASIDSVEESQRYGAAGWLSSGTEARIVDPDSGRVMGVNQSGELWLKGPSIAKGYFRNEEATKETIDSQGWLKTGDLCYIDEDGFLFVVDRLKELIKYKGYQVPPAELETLLVTHPDILDAAVIPFPDKEAGQYPMAYVVRKHESYLSEKQVINFIAEQVAPYKKIRKVSFIDSIPKTPSGKTLLGIEIVPSVGEVDFSEFSTHMALGGMSGVNETTPNANDSAHARRKNPKWTTEQNLVLLNGWIKYRTHNIVGENKKSEAYWGKIAKYCNEYCSFDPPRDGTSCRNHYNYMNKKLSKWTDAYNNARRMEQSGLSENDILAKTHELYSSGKNERFNLMAEWLIVRDQPRYGSQEGKNTSPGSTRSKRACKSDASDSNSVRSSACSMGWDTTKKNGKKKGKGAALEVVNEEWNEFKLYKEQELERLDKIVMNQEKANQLMKEKTQVKKMKMFMKLNEKEHLDDKNKLLLKMLRHDLFSN